MVLGLSEVATFEEETVHLQPGDLVVLFSDGVTEATNPHDEEFTDDLPAADLLISKDVLQHLSNTLVHNFIENNLRKGKYKWVILTNDRGSKNSDVENGGYRAIDLSAPPFDVRGLVDLPIKFGNETTKITSLLDLTQPR
jgi:hypothetical protein